MSTQDCPTKTFSSPECSSAGGLAGKSQLSSTSRSPRTTRVTWALIAANLATFVAMSVATRVWPQVDIMQWAANWGPLSLNGQWWRPLTALFIHTTLIHLLGNMIVLWVIGQRVERDFGGWTFFIFYLSCGIAGSVVGLFFHPESTSVGASAAIFGLAGGLIGLYILKSFKLTRNEWFTFVVIILWTAASIYSARGNPEIDTSAHLAGLSVGVLLGVALLSHSASPSRRKTLIFTAFLVVLISAVIFARHHNAYVLQLEMAEVALEQGRTNDALRYLHIALQQNPQSFFANVSLGEAYLRNLEYVPAEAAIRRALAIDNRNKYAHYLFGTLEAYTGRCTEAHLVVPLLMEHDQRSQLGQDLARAASSCDSLATAQKYLAQGSALTAIDTLKRALVEDPDNYQLYFAISNAYRAIGMQQEADNMHATGLMTQHLEGLGLHFQSGAGRVDHP